MNHYAERYGTTFTTSEGSYHSFRDFGLYPHQHPDIPPAKIKRRYVDIPAADGGIDLSELPQGFTVFENRTGTFPFVVVERSRFDSALTAITAALHGKMAYIIKDEEPNFRYRGRVSVNGLDADSLRGIITVEADLEPFKYELASTTEDWLWDPFNFETGVIREYGNISVNGTKAVTVISSPAGGVPTITASAAMTVTYNGETYNLASGSNVIDDIYFPRGVESVTLTFNGTGTVGIDFLPGYL